MQTIDVTIHGVPLDYAIASAIAQRLTQQAAGETLLLAWFDAKNNAGHPDVQECTGDKPGWLAYAQSHGGNLAVNINGGEFMFVYATGLELQGG